jgi:hypothetical protein
MMISSVALFAGSVPRVEHAPRAGVRVAESTPPPSRDDAAPAPASHIPAPLADADTFLAAQEDKQRKDGGGQSQEQDGQTTTQGLTQEEQQEVSELKSRDQEVRRHERAHAAAAGPYGGLPTFEFQRGPDGRLYAVNGEVKIDVSPERDPAATIAKMEIVIRAAQAPANPSAQDRAVASQAKQMLQRAQAELQAEKRDEKDGSSRRDTANPALADFAQAQNAYTRTADVLSAPLGQGTAQPSLDLAA